MPTGHRGPSTGRDTAGVARHARRAQSRAARSRARKLLERSAGAPARDAFARDSNFKTINKLTNQLTDHLLRATRALQHFCCRTQHTRSLSRCFGLGSLSRRWHLFCRFSPILYPHVCVCVVFLGGCCFSFAHGKLRGRVALCRGTSEGRGVWRKMGISRSQNCARVV